MAVDVGEAITRRVSITNAAGAAVDADALPTYAITLPDGSAGAPPTVTHGVTGEYFVNYTTTAAGLHADLWTATVSGLPVKFGPDTFLVRPSSPAPLLGLAEARRRLGLGSDPSRDEDIREYLEAATELVEDHTGRVYRRRTFSETFDGGRSVLRLHYTPVQSITTVTESGVTVSASGWVLDASAGLLIRGTTSGRSRWADGVQNVAVTGVAGASSPSSKVRQAVRVTLAHLWATQGGASGKPVRAAGASANDYPAGGTGWSLPRAAEELLAEEMPGGFA